MMKKTNMIWLAGGLVVVVAVIALAQARWRNEQGTFKLGVIAPLTGDFGAVGENVVKGIRTAEYVNEKKTGKKVDIIVENDNADAATGLGAFTKLTQVDHVDGLINTFTSTMDAIYQPGKALGYPVMMEFLQANNIADDYVFQMTLGNRNVWDRYANYIEAQPYDQSRVVVVHSVDAAQASFAAGFTANYQQPTTVIVISSDPNELRTDAVKIAAGKPTMVVLFMPPENGAILTKELLPLIGTSTQLVYDIQLYTGMSYYERELGGDLSKINGAINLMFQGDPSSTAYQEFVNAYEKLYPGETPGFLADYGYDTFNVYMGSYSKDDATWIANLKVTNIEGASGKITFDQDGVRIPDLVVMKVIAGKPQTVDRLPY